MSKRIPKYINENDLQKIPCPKCNGVTRVFFYSAVPEVIVCPACKIGWELNTEIRYKTEKITKREAKEYAESGR